MEQWWPILAVTTGLFALAVGLIASVLYQQRVRTRSRREKEALVRESERRYGTLFNAVSDIVYVHDLDGRLLDVNHSGAALLGERPEALLGRNIAELFGARETAASGRYLRSLRSPGATASGLFPLVRDGKLVVLEFRSVAGVGTDGTPRVQGIARDITRQKEDERALRQRERQMRRLLERAEGMQEDLRLLSREILRVQEEERRKIGRELHDEIGQMMTAITLNLQLMKRNPGAAEQSALAGQIVEAERLAGNVFQRIRKVLRELRPVAVDEAGLLAAIRQMAKEQAERTGADITVVEEAGDVEMLDDERKATVFRVIQECLTNIAKHARATTVAITIARHGGSLAVEVRDDGVGFDPRRDARSREGGFGLLGMRERVQLVRGEFQLVSAPGKGTDIRVVLPLRDSAELLEESRERR